jgi:hypothetical protein
MVVDKVKERKEHKVRVENSRKKQVEVTPMTEKGASSDDDEASMQEYREALSTLPWVKSREQ